MFIRFFHSYPNYYQRIIKFLLCFRIYSSRSLTLLSLRIVNFEKMKVIFQVSEKGGVRTKSVNGWTSIGGFVVAMVFLLLFFLLTSRFSRQEHGSSEHTTITKFFYCSPECYKWVTCEQDVIERESKSGR